MPKGGKGGSGSGFDQTIRGNRQDNILTGHGGTDDIDGRGGNDVLDGRGGNDLLKGGGGSDTLIGGAGDDTLQGGDGSDTAVYSGNRADYTITQIDATTVEIAGADGTDTVTGVETFQFADIALSFAELFLPVYDLAIGAIAFDPAASDTDLGGDPFTGTGDGATLSLSWDVSNPGLAASGAATITFYLSADGTLSGDDLILGADTVALDAGGTASGTLTVAVPQGVTAGDYTVIAQIDGPNGDEMPGNDTASFPLSLSGGLLAGTAGNDALTGTDFNDEIFADAGDDTIFGSDGLDEIDGGAGTDTVDYSGLGEAIEFRGSVDYDVVLTGGEGKDVLTDIEGLIGTAHDDLIRKTLSGLERIDGGAGNDTITGSSGNETMLGGDGDDLIYAYLGSDAVDGGTGADTLYLSGQRADFAVTQTGDQSVTLQQGDDIKTVTGIETFVFSDFTQTFAEVIVPLDPNLTAGDLLVETATLTQGDVLHVGWDLASTGNADAGDSTTHVVLSTAPDLASVIETFGTTQTGALPTGSLAAFSDTLDTTGLAPGTYYVAAVADAEDVLAESDETDNVTQWTAITIQAQVSDYALSDVQVLAGSDLDIGGGARLDVAYTVTNDSKTGPTDFTVTTYLSTDGTLAGAVEQIGTQQVSVGLGETLATSASFTTADTLVAGDYFVVSSVARNDPSGAPDDPSDNVAATATPITLIGGVTFGTPGDDLFVGTGAIETFDGGEGDDTLTGDDIILDTFLGGAGIDTLDFSQMTFDDAYSGVAAIGETIETGGTGLTLDETVTAYTGGGPLPQPGFADGIERIIGSDHDDSLGALNSAVTYIDGGAGNDAVIGSYADDTLLGGSGDDQMAGIFGDDIISTGEGFDIVFFDREADGAGGFTGHGHDVVTDFDPLSDMIVVEYDAGIETYDPFADLTQTAEGVLLTMADDSSVLLQGILIEDLTEANLMTQEDPGEAYVWY